MSVVNGLLGRFDAHQGGGGLGRDGEFRLEGHNNGTFSEDLDAVILPLSCR